MPPFDVERFRHLLRTRFLGQACHYCDVLASTNASMQALARLGDPEGTIVLADAQTAGRGQANKVWISPAWCNLYVSVLLRPVLAPMQAPLISLLTAVALVDALDEEGVACGIKWPNDILIQQRKVAGILTEMEMHQGVVQFVVVGIGINVNMTEEDLEEHLGPIARRATSLRVALGHEVPREKLLAGCLEKLEAWYNRFTTHGETTLQEAWEARSVMLGRRIAAQTPEATWEGIAEGIDPAGHLRLRQNDGALVVLTSAAIRFLDGGGS